MSVAYIWGSHDVFPGLWLLFPTQATQPGDCLTEGRDSEGKEPPCLAAVGAYGKKEAL